jgi:hypothetical protein
LIPPFDESGNLPPGIHKVDWDGLQMRFGGSLRRVELLAGLHQALAALRDAGCRTAYVDGSFVTAKENPGDFDVCWDASGVDAGLLDPALLEFGEGRRTQKQRFGGELFPSIARAEPGGTRFLEFFQRDRETGAPKGIVELDPERLA